MLNTPLCDVTFISVDVETTGLDPRRDAIVEIGAVKVKGRLARAGGCAPGDPLGMVDEFETLVYATRTIPLQARRVHGISNEMLVGKPRIGEAMAMLTAFAAGGALVEHSNRAFDVLFLERALGAPIGAPYVNTCMLSRRLFPHMPRHSLDACCRRFGIANHERDSSGRHRALADARATAQLLQKLLELCSTRYPRLGDLVEACTIQR